MINREIAPFKETDKAEVPLSCLTIAEDFGRAFVQSAVIAPLWNGLGQLVTGGHLPHVSIVNEKNAESNVADSWAQKFGGAIGMAADFHLLGKLKLGPFRQVETANTLSLAQRCGQHFMRSAKQGAVYGAVFTESDPSNNMLYGRVANAGSQALTFGLLGSGSEALSGLKGLAGVKPGTFKNALSDMTIAGIVGVPVGAVGSVADATLNGQPVSVNDVQNAAIDYGIIGFALAGINHGVAALRSGRDVPVNTHSIPLEMDAAKSASSTLENIPNEARAAVVRNAMHQRASYNGWIDDAERMIERQCLSLEELRGPARKWLAECISTGRMADAERIIERKWVTEEDLQVKEIREAAFERFGYSLSNGWIDDVDTIIARKWVTEEDLKANKIREAAGKGLVMSISYGSTSTADTIVARNWLTAEEIRETLHQGVMESISNGWIYAVERLFKSEWVAEEDLKADDIRKSARKGLVESLSNGYVGDAEKMLKRKWVTEEEIREAACQGLVGCLSKGSIFGADEIIARKWVTEEEIREAARQGLAGCISKGSIFTAEEIIARNWVTEEGIREAAGQGLIASLSNGQIDDAERIIKRKWVEPSAIDEIFRQSAQAGHVTSVVRIGLSIGKDFNTIAKEYLGTSKLTNEEARRLFEKMKEMEGSWKEDGDDLSFEEAARLFGEARMLRYIFKANATPHEALDGFGDVIRMFQSSGLSAEDFYSNVLRQVNRDNAIDDIGHSYARLKAIAMDCHDNFDAVMEKAKQYPDVATIQDLAVRFPDKASIFSSWAKLQQYSKLEYFIGRSELLPKIQELRLAGQLKRAKWLESLALHPDSKVAKDPIEEFLLQDDPIEFLERSDQHSAELHDLLKPSNYVEIPHLDLTAKELREALIDGSLDKLQVFTPMKVEYEVGGVDLPSELKRALGSREKGEKGQAQNPKKLFSEVSKFLKQDKLTIAEVVQGSEMSQDLAVKITGLLYNKEIGLSRPPDSFKLVAEIHKKSDPLAVVAGDDTASCMEFGSGKNNVYMFNPNDALFTLRLERPDGTRRTIAQSVLTKDVDVRESVPAVIAKMQDKEPVHHIFPEESFRNGRRVIAADNVEVHPNYNSDAYKSALEGVYRDFFGRYVELYGDKGNLQSDKIVVGLGHSDALQSLPKEDNTYMPQAPVAYSDKTHEQVSRFSLIAPQTKAVKASVPTQLVRTMTADAKEMAITELTFEDALPLSYLESKMYKDLPITQGLYDLENRLIAKDINNVSKGRENLSFKYTDKSGKMRGYLLAYEGKVEIDGAEKPAIYMEDFASDSYLEPTKQGESGDVGGKLLLKFAKSYKQNYLDKGNLMPIYMNARSTTSHALLMKHMQSLGRKFGYRFEIEEGDTRHVGSETMHDVLLVPKRIEAAVLVG